MDVVLVGLPGSGKTAIGRRLANRHGAAFVDLDERIEEVAGRRIPEIFAEDGEAAFRRLERDAVLALGPADPEPAIRRVIAPGGGAVVDPRNRWALYRGRVPIWLGRPPRGPGPAPAALAERAPAGPGWRPAGPNPAARRGPRALLRGGTTAQRHRRDQLGRGRRRPAGGILVRRRPPRCCGPGRASASWSWARAWPPTRSASRCGGSRRDGRSWSRSPEPGRHSARGLRKPCVPTAGRWRP